MKLPEENVWDYPRPPKLEHVPQTVRVEFNGVTLVDSQNTKRVLETSHPPTYYVPPDDIRMEYLRPSNERSSFCEWKGKALYHHILVADAHAAHAGWSYPNPTPPFADIKDHVAFYPSKMSACFVGDERVLPQDGDFYGGWVTSNLSGPFKGAPGTMHW